MRFELELYIHKHTHTRCFYTKQPAAHSVYDVEEFIELENIEQTADVPDALASASDDDNGGFVNSPLLFRFANFTAL